MDIQQVKTEQQLRVLEKLAGEIWHEYFPSILSEEQIDYMVEKFQSYRAIREQLSGGYAYFLFLKSGEPIGYMGICPQEEKLFLSKLYLKKEFRGYGFASEAFRFLEQYCAENGLQAIWLTVNKQNDHSIAVYQNKGFDTVRSEVADIGCGFVMDDYIMETKLNV